MMTTPMVTQTPIVCKPRRAALVFARVVRYSVGERLRMPQAFTPDATEEGESMPKRKILPEPSFPLPIPMRRAFSWAALIALFALASACGATGEPPGAPNAAANGQGDPITAADAQAILAAFPHRGPDGDVPEIVVFADFKCPHCKTYEETVMPELLKRYVDSGQARLIYVTLPVLGGDAVSAAKAALAVYDQRPEAFFPYAEALFRAQQGVNEAWATPATLANIAHQVAPEIDAEAVKAAAARGEDPRLDDAMRLARVWGVEGVPSVLVDGRAVDDPFDLKAIGEMIAAHGRSPR